MLDATGIPAAFEPGNRCISSDAFLSCRVNEEETRLMRDLVNHPKHFRRGFTLVELLVVITVITILIALLLPALSGSRQVSLTTGCLSNIHQLAIAYDEYLNANCPRGWLFDDGSWPVELTPFLGTPGAPGIVGPYTASSSPWNTTFTGPPFAPTGAAYISPQIQTIFLCPATHIVPWTVPGSAGGYWPGWTLHWPDSEAVDEAWGRLWSASLNNGVPWAGSYTFNSWLYNVYDATDATHSYNPFQGGPSVTYSSIESTLDGASYADGSGTLSSNPSSNGGHYTQSGDAYTLSWTYQPEQMTPNVPVFCDGLWADAATSPEDQPSAWRSAAPVLMVPATGVISSSANSSYSGSSANFSTGTGLGMFRVCINRHNMHVNIGCVDGHAETVLLGNLWTLPWANMPMEFSKPAPIEYP
jgi:prepilin-type N-terminal cleavage/methylation domain-containing protein